MTKVLVFGTFDILHPGHLHFLKQAKKYGHHLSVVVARDKTVQKIKGKKPTHSETQRLAQIKKLGLVNQVFLGNSKDKYRIIEKIKPQIICLGYDQNSFTQNLKIELAKRKIKSRVLRLKAFQPEKYKSSLLKN